MILREIVTKLGFSIDHPKLKEFDNAISKVKANITSLGVAANVAKKAVYGIVGAATGLSLISLHTAKSTKDLAQLAERLGVTAEELQSVELAAQATGLGVNELSDSMNTFHKKLGEVGQGNTEASRQMAQLGVRFTGTNGKIKSSFQLYEELAQKIDSIKSPIAKANALQKIFGTENIELARLFRNGGEALRAQREEIEKIGYIIDSKGIKSSKEYLKSWSEFQIIISSVKKELSIKFMPVFNSFMKVFKTWFGENRKLISQNISSFINLFSKALEVLFRALNLIITPINKVIESMGGLENTVSVLGVALGVLLIPRIYASVVAFRALTVAILANPITWITAAIAALGVAIGLLVNDLWHWVEGNDSAIGEILGDWNDFKTDFFKIIDDITGYFTTKFTELGDWFSNFWNNTLNLDNILNKLDNVVNKTFEDVQVYLKTPKNGLPRHNAFTGSTAAPIILSPSSPTSGVVPGSTYSTDKKVNQYITENITITVPSGTSSEQSRAIATQVAQEMQLQFNVNMQRGLDSLSSR